ncbi:MAG: D-alanyl-D-alanine carboxypeptidase [Phenylobacterium sp.]|nr:D-alanyl-D-alanine carboxypeptidase [Phenylobacterium sp.]
MRRALVGGVRFKPSEALRFLGGLAAAVVVLGLIALRVTSCAPAPPPPGRLPVPAERPGLPPPRPVQAPSNCAAGPPGPTAANAASLTALAWAPFRRAEFGWEVYAPLIAREIRTACPPQSPGFAGALAAWERAQGLPGDGTMSEADFQRLKGVMGGRRPFLLLSAKRICPAPPPMTSLEVGRPGEGYSGTVVMLRPAAFAAYRRMVAAARAEDPRIAADPRNLTIFSGFRSPEADAARCVADGNCNGVVRATCSPHRTGLALDMYVGQAPGYGPDSSADPNRLFMSRTPAYRWLVANADRFGFVPYAFEPWHWEWTGEAP